MQVRVEELRTRFGALLAVAVQDSGGHEIRAKEDGVGLTSDAERLVVIRP